MRENDVAMIKECYRNFLKAWETEDSELFDKCLKSIPFAYVSMFGHTYSADQVKKWFVNPGPEGSQLKLYPLQETILTQKDEAQQYAAVIGVIRKDDRHIAFGGSFMNHYENTENGWVLETIRFQLQSDDGNKEEYLDAEGLVHRIPGEGDRNLFGKWLLVDDRVGFFQDKIEHSGDLMITAEMDAPWRVIRRPDNTMTEEEQINDVICRTSCAFDFFARMVYNLLGWAFISEKICFARRKRGLWNDRFRIFYFYTKERTARRHARNASC